MAIKFFNDVAVDSDVLYVDTINDRVGIGTTNPQAKLDVNGKILATWAEFTTTVNFDPGTDDLSVSGFGIQGNRTSNPIYVHNHGNGGVRISSNSTLGQVNGMLVTDTSVNIAGDLVVSGGDITLSGTGRIQGIDTVFAGTDAASKAYVDAQTAGQVTGTGTTDTIPLWSDGPNGVISNSIITQNSVIPRITVAGQIALTSNTLISDFSSSYFNGGNVGIGTTNPAKKLDVAGNIRCKSPGSGQYVLETQYSNSISGGGFYHNSASGMELRLNNTSGIQTIALRGNAGVTDSFINVGNLGIGTTGPGYKLEVSNSNTTQTTLDSLTFRAVSTAYAGTVGVFENTSGINTSIRISDTVDDMYVVSRNGIMGLGPSGGWSSSNLNIKSNGYVGIGNRNPSERLHVKNGNLRVDTGRVNFYEGSTNRGYVGPNGSILDVSSTYKIVFKTGAAQTEKMRLTDDGRLLLNAPDNASAANSRFEVIGTSSDSTTNLTFKTSGRIGLGDYNPDAKITVVGTTNNTSSNLVKIQNVSNTGSVVDFRNSGGVQAGKISMPTSTTVNYGTTSDYRLKTNITALRDGIEKVKKLKPSRFEWIDNGVEVDGFIAHEVAKVVPEAVTGEKDAVDQKNKPVYQDLDYSKVIPVLTAALQEAIQKIEQLETRIQTLENK